MARTMVTTSDNPYNPFKQYEAWKAFDEVICKYFTEPYIGRIVATSPDLSPAEYDQAVEDAVDEIIDMDLRYISPITGKEIHYVKVIDSGDEPKAS